MVENKFDYLSGNSYIPLLDLTIIANHTH